MMRWMLFCVLSLVGVGAYSWATEGEISRTDRESGTTASEERSADGEMRLAGEEMLLKGEIRGEENKIGLAEYIDAAKNNSPLLKDYQNQTAIQEAEMERLKGMYLHSRLEVNGEYLFVPIVSHDGGKPQFEWNAQSANDYYGYDLGESSGHLYAGLSWRRDTASVSYGGSYAEQQQSFHELTIILLPAVLLVFAVLMFLFKEWQMTILILFISVMGICGCLLALWLTGTPLNVSSYTGIIMVVGIIAENAIFTVLP